MPFLLMKHVSSWENSTSLSFLKTSLFLTVLHLCFCRRYRPLQRFLKSPVIAEISPISALGIVGQPDFASRRVFSDLVAAEDMYLSSGAHGALSSALAS